MAGGLSVCLHVPNDNNSDNFIVVVIFAVVDSGGGLEGRNGVLGVLGWCDSDGVGGLPG